MKMSDQAPVRNSGESDFTSGPNIRRGGKTTTCCFCLECAPYYWKELNAKGASKVLSNLPVGSYLLRPSTHPSYIYTLSQKMPVMGVTHIRIGCSEAGLYYMETDDSFANSRMAGFRCVINMVDSWSRVYREIGVHSVQEPVPNEEARSAISYINSESKCVCFHEDDKATESVRNFVLSIVREKSRKV